MILAATADDDDPDRITMIISALEVAEMMVTFASAVRRKTLDLETIESGFRAYFVAYTRDLAPFNDVAREGLVAELLYRRELQATLDGWTSIVRNHGRLRKLHAKKAGRPSTPASRSRARTGSRVSH